jgi:hypothetical protein
MVIFIRYPPFWNKKFLLQTSKKQPLKKFSKLSVVEQFLARQTSERTAGFSSEDVLRPHC